MKILFLHPNFPGQFARPAALMAKQDNDVRFLCHTHFERKIKGVMRITLKGRLGEDELNSKDLSVFKRTLALAEQFREGMEELKSIDWNPDLIISHTGFGCGLHSANVWPNTTKIAYLEWWFAENSELGSYDVNNKWWPKPFNKVKVRNRNMPLALEIIESSTVISPTIWQKKQLPLSIRSSCKVIHEGVDCERFKPEGNKFKSKTPLLTYGTRGMEPMRGFPEFIEELPDLLETNKDLNVEIAGEDRICYGAGKPKEGSYGKWAEQILEKWIKENRVRFVGRIGLEDYIKWLQSSWIHVHFTRPFVASWSLLEAMASGCCLIASDTSPIREFLNNKNAILIDHRKKGELNEKVNFLLQHESIRASIAEAACRHSANWSEEKTKHQWKALLAELSGDRDWNI